MSTRHTPRGSRPRNGETRYDKKSFQAALEQTFQQQERNTAASSRRRHTNEDDATTETISPESPFALATERFTLYVNKMDSTKAGLAFLFTMAIILMQYGMQKQTKETLKLMEQSSSHGTKFKASGTIRTFKNALEEKGYGARSQVTIPMEYSHFVELTEFSDAVEFIRVHREKELQNQQHRHVKRRLDENDDDEAAETQNAMDATWEHAIQQTDSSQLQQMQSSLPSVKHIPFFWHIPRSGATTLTTILGTCLGLVQAASSYSSPAVYTRWEDQTLATRFKDPKLYVVHMKQQQFVNVDLNDFQGVMRAAKGKLISSELADLVVVQDVSMGSILFEEGNNDEEGTNPNTASPSEFQGVLFAMFRHPIDRAISVFYSKQQVHDVHFDPTLEIYSLKDWVNSPSYVNDYMVLSLVVKLNERSPQNQPPLNRNDLDVAKEILRRKCLIGLLDEKSESLKRFENFFGWNAEIRHDSMVIFGGEDTAQRAQKDKFRKEIADPECKDRILHYNWEKKHKHPLPEEDELSYRLLESKNRYDIELYVYARQLFDEQYLQLGFDDETIMGG